MEKLEELVRMVASIRTDMVMQKAALSGALLVLDDLDFECDSDLWPLRHDLTDAQRDMLGAITDLNCAIDKINELNKELTSANSGD